MSTSAGLHEILRDLNLKAIAIAEHYRDADWQQRVHGTLHGRSNMNGVFGKAEKVITATLQNSQPAEPQQATDKNVGDPAVPVGDVELEELRSQANCKIEAKLFRYSVSRHGVKHGINITDAKKIVDWALRKALQGIAAQQQHHQEALERQNVESRLKELEYLEEVSDCIEDGCGLNAELLRDGLLRRIAELRSQHKGVLEKES